MNPICELCIHKKFFNNKFECDMAYYEVTDHGRYKRGSICIHDFNLENKFSLKDHMARTSLEIVQALLEKYQINNMKLRDRITELKKRLVE